MRLAVTECRIEPLRPDREAFRVADGTEVPTLAGESKQVLMRAVGTANARESVLQDAAGEGLVRDLRDHGAPWAGHGPYSRAKRSSYTAGGR